ncbi:hypothetical protein IC582_009660 [Cucumis melo]
MAHQNELVFHQLHLPQLLCSRVLPFRCFWQQLAWQLFCQSFWQQLFLIINNRAKLSREEEEAPTELLQLSGLCPLH